MRLAGGLYRIKRTDITLVLAIGAGQVVSLIIFVVLLRNIVNMLVPQQVGASADAVWRMAILQCSLLFVVALVQGWLRAVEFNITEAAGYRIVRDLRMTMYRHLQGMTPRQFQGRARGGLLLRFLGDLSMLRMWISRGVLSGMVAALVLLGTLVALLILNLWMSLAIIATLCIGAVFSLGVGRNMRQATRTMRRRRSLVMSNIDEQMNAQAVVQAFGRAGGEYSRLSHQNDTLTRALIRVARLRGYLRGVSTATSLAAVGSVVMVGLLEVWNGTSTVGMVVAFVVVIRQLAGPVRRLGLAHDYWHRAQVSQQKISEFLRSSSRELDAPGLERLRVRRGAIEFADVGVSGSISGVNLRIEAGQFVAITGDGGAGKSTLLGLVARVIEPTSGTIVIDGQRLDQTTLRSTVRRIGVVGPDLPLLRGTVRRNLTYGDPGATAEEIERVVRASGLDELFTELPGGIECWVTEGGQNLSVSQRQRIALGRALMGNPPILLLDEPTDGLDAADAAAFAGIMSRHRGTVLLATHEPSEIALADVVVVLRKGQVERVLSGEKFRDELWAEHQRGVQWTPNTGS